MSSQKTGKKTQWQFIEVRRHTKTYICKIFCSGTSLSERQRKVKKINVIFNILMFKK